jgi:hypothetical protein
VRGGNVFPHQLALVVALVFAQGCSSTGTAPGAAEAGADATTSSDASEDAGEGDAGTNADATLPPCVPLSAPQTTPSDDCVFAGACPLDCLAGTASAYACVSPPVLGDAGPSPAYPANFTAPIGIVNVVAAAPSGYPWDAATYVSCAPIACVRWSFADHVGGTSAWSGDPCADGGNDTEAWACPTAAGLKPPVPGCFDTGGLGAIGGPGTGVPAQNVWCCPGPADAGIDAGAVDAAVVDASISDGASTDGD